MVRDPESKLEVRSSGLTLHYVNVSGEGGIGWLAGPSDVAPVVKPCRGERKVRLNKVNVVIAANDIDI